MPEVWHAAVMRHNRGKPDSQLARTKDELQEMDERISALAEDDPLGARAAGLLRGREEASELPGVDVRAVLGSFEGLGVLHGAARGPQGLDEATAA